MKKSVTYSPENTVAFSFFFLFIIIILHLGLNEGQYKRKDAVKYLLLEMLQKKILVYCSYIEHLLFLSNQVIGSFEQ